MLRLALFLLCLSVTGCVRHDDVVLPYDASGTLYINEVYAAGSNGKNTFSEAADWLEVYNAGVALRLEAEEWFLTDDRDNLLKYELPGLSLGSDHYIRIWCDGLEVEDEELHTSFKLSNKGEWLALVQVRSGVPTVVDSVRYAPQQAGDGRSASRYPDASTTWVPSTLRTPGAPNTHATEVE